MAISMAKNQQFNILNQFQRQKSKIINLKSAFHSSQSEIKNLQSKIYNLAGSTHLKIKESSGIISLSEIRAILEGNFIK